MKRINQLLNIALVGLALGVTQGVSAQPSPSTGIGPGSTPALTTTVPCFPGLGWALGLDSDLVTISADPSAGVWLKTLPLECFINPAGVGPDAVGIDPGTQFLLLEILGVGDGPAWRDWHETILTPGWGWGILQDGISLPNIFSDLGQTQIPGLEWSILDDQVIDFTFDPLNPGQFIVIAKVLQCIDETGCDTSEIQVTEYPSIPEPATLALLGLGLAGLAASRRRRL